MKQVGSDAVRRRRVEDGFLAGNAAQAFFDVVGTFLEHERPGAVAAAAATPSAGLELAQTEGEDAELDALVDVDVDLPRTAAGAGRSRGQRDVAVLLGAQCQVTVRRTPVGCLRRRRHCRQQPSSPVGTITRNENDNDNSLKQNTNNTPL